METQKDHKLAKKILKIMEDLDYDQQLEVIYMTREKLSFTGQLTLF